MEKNISLFNSIFKDLNKFRHILCTWTEIRCGKNSVQSLHPDHLCVSLEKLTLKSTRKGQRAMKGQGAFDNEIQGWWKDRECHGLRLRPRNQQRGRGDQGMELSI